MSSRERWRTRLGAGLLAAWVGGGLVPGAVLTTITVDGDMFDWTAVLADPYQRADDGPAGGLPDRDAPVQSTGRDLVTFAWTYDASYLYFLVGRSGNTSNVQRFWFYVDTDEDGLMETGEPVIGVAWKGSSGKTDITRYSYNASAPGGDPLGDASGSADGWDMPGTLSSGFAVESLSGGEPGRQFMESRISWGNLGVPPATPLRFHVASSNSVNLPTQIDDNMGGPGGLVGSTRLGGVSIVADATSTVVPGGFGVLAHQITNLGTSDDRFNLSWIGSAGFLPTGALFHLDADGDGLLGAGDPPLADTDGDGLPNTDLVPPGATLSILAVIDAPTGLTDGETSTVVITASSAGSPFFTDDVTDVLTVAIPDITLVKTVDASDARPGDVLTYTVTYTSAGSVDARTVVLTDAVPAPAVYVSGSATGSGTLIDFSHDGGGTFDGSDAPPVTHIRWSLAAPLPPGSAGSVSFQASIP